MDREEVKALLLYRVDNPIKKIVLNKVIEVKIVKPIIKGRVRRSKTNRARFSDIPKKAGDKCWKIQELRIRLVENIN